MGTSGNANLRKKIYKDSQDKSNNLIYRSNDHDLIVKTDLKKILFLLFQRKEFNKHDDKYEQKSFYVIKANFKILEQKYFLNIIIEYFNLFIKKLTLKEKIDWDKIINQLQNSYQNLEKKEEGKIEINPEIEYYKTKK